MAIDPNLLNTITPKENVVKNLAGSNKNHKRKKIYPWDLITQPHTQPDAQNINDKRADNSTLAERTDLSFEDPDTNTPYPYQEASAHEVITDNNKQANLSLNSNQTINKQETNRKQIGNKSETNRNQTVNKISSTGSHILENRKQTVSGTVIKSETNGKQTVSGTVNKKAPQKDGRTTFTMLCGLQKNITLLIFNYLQLTNEKITPPMTAEYFSTTLNTTSKTIKTSIQRLVEKGILQRKISKVGRSGHTQYSLSKEIYQEIIQAETVTKSETNRNQTVSGTVSGTVNGPLSSSSYIELNNKTTTTSEHDGAWALITIPEILRELSFSRSIIQQVQSGGLLTPEELQNSLEAFAADVIDNNILKEKSIKSALNYFMAIVRRKMSYPYPANYKTDEDRAIEEALRLRQEYALRIKEREKRLADAEFTIWLDELSEQEKRNPEFFDGNFRFLGDVHLANLRGHFDQMIWPQKLEQFKKQFST